MTTDDVFALRPWPRRRRRPVRKALAAVDVKETLRVLDSRPGFWRSVFQSPQKVEFEGEKQENAMKFVISRGRTKVFRVRG